MTSVQVKNRYLFRKTTASFFPSFVDLDLLFRKRQFLPESQFKYFRTPLGHRDVFRNRSQIALQLVFSSKIHLLLLIQQLSLEIARSSA